MLARLHIENIAIIDALDLPLEEGFNVFTGETGAGKSIIIDSVKLVLGGRADRELIKAGASKALVEALFILCDPQVSGKLQALGIDAQEDLVLSRELTAGMKNTCRANGRLIPLSTLKAAGELLVDLLGQNEHQSLQKKEMQRAYIDGMPGTKAAELLAKLADKYGEWKALLQALEKTGTPAEQERRLDILAYQQDEIEKTAMQSGEEEALQEERGRLANAEAISGALSSAYELLHGGEVSAAGLLKQAAAALGKVSQFSAEYAALEEALSDAYYALEDGAVTARQLGENTAFDPQRLAQIEERLEALRALKRKYGASYDEIMEFYEGIQQEIEDITGAQRLAQQGDAAKRTLEEEMYSLSRELSAERRKAAAVLEEEMAAQLADLGLGKTAFAVEFSELPDYAEGLAYSRYGLDAMEMVISTNPGEPLRPLHKVASGGEMSRVMLALKAIAAEQDDIPCLIFDEIDAGVSGRIAAAVGEKMRAIAKRHQVICVTHSPQIAALGDAHYLIEKSETRERAQTSARMLDEGERAGEIARILGATGGEKTALEHARTLLARRD